MEPTITVQTTIKAPIEKVWESWTKPEHITKWNQASDDWHTPHAENDLRIGGRFLFRMEAKDGTVGFDFRGVYDEVKNHEKIVYHTEDGRNVESTFTANGSETTITGTFVPENENPHEMQRGGWQAILDNFKKYTESLNN